MSKSPYGNVTISIILAFNLLGAGCSNSVEKKLVSQPVVEKETTTVQYVLIVPPTKKEVTPPAEKKLVLVKGDKIIRVSGCEKLKREIDDYNKQHPDAIKDYPC